MADSEKKSPAVNSKEKNNQIDLDIEKDFLSPWKLMSAADGDDMDFDLPTVSKGNKKSFNFEKADMEFNLDGDFCKMSSFDMDMSDLDISPPFKNDGKSKEKSKESSSGNDKGKARLKLSSFDLDMSDLDISPPLKKDEKSKEKSKEPSTENDRGKADHFAFAFDFDELGNFNFEPSLARKSSKAHKDRGDMESLENFNFERSLTKEGSKAQKDKNTAGCLENINFEPSLAKEGSKPQEDKDDIGSLENLNIEPSSGNDGSEAQKDENRVESIENFTFESSLSKECSRTLKDNDAIGGMESFNFGRSIAEEGSMYHKYKDSVENPPDASGCEYKEASAQMNVIDNMSTTKHGHQKPSKLEAGITFDMDFQVGGRADIEPAKENYPSKSSIDEPVTSTCSAAAEQVSFDKEKTHSETEITSTRLPNVNRSDKCLPLKYVDHETSAGKDANLACDSRSNKVPSGYISSSEAPEKLGRMNKNSTGLVEAEIVNVTLDAASTCNYEHTMSKTSPYFQTVAISNDKIEKSQRGIQNQLVDNTEKTDLVEVNSLVQNSCISVLALEIPTDKSTGRKNQEHDSVIPESASVSELPDKLLPEKEPEIGELPFACQRSSIQLEKLKGHVQKASSTQTTNLSLSSKKNGFTQPALVEERRNLGSIQSGKSLASLPMQHSKTLLRMELPQTKSRESCKGLEICGEKGPDIAGVQKMKNLNDSFTQNLDLVKAKPVLRSVKDLDSISSSVTPRGSRMEINKRTAQTSKIPIKLASLPSSKSTPAETEKLSADEGTKRAPEICSPKLASLNLNSMKCPSLNDVRLTGNIRQISPSLRNTPERVMAPSDGSQKQTPSLSLKRKTLEVYNADKVILNPSKRVSQSPTLSRSFMATSRRAYDKKVSKNNVEDVGMKSTLEASQASPNNILCTVNSKTLEMSVYIENNSNIKQAEAYTKELDDICNTLRKKQEEAKELLVRATVNSNKMLMLNPLLLDQKICAIQNSFASLSLNRNCA